MYNFRPPEIDIYAILPVIAVVVTGLIALIIEMLRPKSNNNLIVGTSIVGLMAAAAAVIYQWPMVDVETFGDMVVRDRLGLVAQLILIGSTILTLLFSESYLREKRIAFGEFYPLVLWSLSGAMVMVTTRNLLMLFVGLEVLSIALYVLAGLSRSEEKSEESAIKYFLLGAFATGFLLYGIAFIFGATGSLNLDQIAVSWRGEGIQGTLAVFGVGLMLVGLGFKSAFVPFHQWTPDVYQGAPTNVTAFMAAGSKIAAIVALSRVLDAAYPVQNFWMPAMFWVAILTMTVGNVVACRQRDVKRILGYSSIAHAGYLLVGVLAHSSRQSSIGMETTLYYLVAYSFMTVGAFAVISLAARNGAEGTRLRDLNGLWKRSPFLAGCLVLFMASLIGVPPTAGFFGKLQIFTDALNAGLTPLAIVLAVNSVISVYFYVGIMMAAFVDDEQPDQVPLAPAKLGVSGACALCAAGVLALAVYFTPFMDWMVK